MYVSSAAVGPEQLPDGRLAMEVKTLHPSVIQELIAVTDVVVPGGKGDRLRHVWLQDGHEVHRTSEETSRIDGPKGVVRLRSSLTDKDLPADLAGPWRVDVETEDGQLVGRAEFEVRSGIRADACGFVARLCKSSARTRSTSSTTPSPSAEGVTQSERSLSDGSAFATLTAHSQSERKPLVVLGVPDADHAMGREAHVLERGGEAGRFVVPGGQNHHRPLVELDVQRRGPSLGPSRARRVETVRASPR